MSYYFRDYVPLAEIKRTPIESEVVLDYLNARYIKAFTNVSYYTTFTVTYRERGRLDLICNQFFDDRPDLITVLARYNKIIDPLKEVYVGRIIFIPSLSALEEALENSNSVQVTESTYLTLR